MMDQYAQLTGERLTYAELAKRVGVAPSTIESVASRRDYNPTLKMLGRLCVVLQCSPGELLVLKTEPAMEHDQSNFDND
ncbi:helix-turn-helix domain-containing protein [Burkholderia gladioli]|uniref:helix-turn-helix domain-containing protein n=2 Tax=Burkholderia gladioli TaxID=28095 RepID=UPI00163F5F6C